MKTQDVLIAHPTTVEQVNALKAFMQALKITFEISTVKDSYNPDFVKKIQKSRQQYNEGEFESIEKDNLKNLLGLQ
jgi:hypothetical protein